MRALEYVYVVGNGHAVKIGKSTTPEARIASLHTSSSPTFVTYYVGATSGEGGAIERAAHSLLRPFRLNGEWFSSTPEAAIGAVEEAARSLGVAIIRCDAIRIEAAPTAIHVDPGVVSGTPAITRRQRDAPVVHKLNLSVPRGLIGTMLLAFAAAVGIMMEMRIMRRWIWGGPGCGQGRSPGFPPYPRRADRPQRPSVARCVPLPRAALRPRSDPA